MKSKEKSLLNVLQFNFPLQLYPYRVIGKRIGLSEERVMKSIARLKQQGVIRRIGAVFEARRLKHRSVLVAAVLPQERVESARSVMNSYPEITHSYLRPHRYNLWFTVTSTSLQKIKKILAELKQEIGIEKLRILPALKVFKIDTRFRL
jgi:DNA-binding Lrp family transcriptional regulator